MVKAYNNDTERAANAYFDNPNAILDQVSPSLFQERVLLTNIEDSRVKSNTMSAGMKVNFIRTPGTTLN